LAYLLLFTSVFLDTFKNIYYNYFGKNLMQGKRDTLFFNVVCCIGAVIYFICRGALFGVSSYSLIMAIIFGAVTVAAQYFGLLSMGLGPMSYSVLFTYLSMLIPVTFGIIYGGNIPTALQIAGIVLMLVTFVLSCELKGNTKVTYIKKGLKAGKGYYFKVRAYKTYGNRTTYGEWSKSKSFATNGTRWYTKNGKKYYYEKGKLVKGRKMFGSHQYFFNYEDGAWSGASPKMWRKVKNSYSKTDYLIAVSRELNRLCVYEGKKGNWKLKYYWMCSTGRPENGKVSKTPTGSWLMPKEDNHLGYIGGHETYTCWYATRFYKRCFFHSVIYNPASKSSIQDGRLGMNISDGCIRMNIDDAKWIWDNCHTGTRVIVY